VVAAAMQRNAIAIVISPASLRLFISLLSLPGREQKSRIRRVKYWEIITDNLKKAGWSYGYVSAIDSQGRTIWIVDAHRDDGKRFIVRADEKLTAFAFRRFPCLFCGS